MFWYIDREGMLFAQIWTVGTVTRYAPGPYKMTMSPPKEKFSYNSDVHY